MKSVIMSITILISSYASANTYTELESIRTVTLYGLGNIGVSHAATLVNPANCVHTDTYKLYKITDTTDHGKNMYAMVLAAKTAQKELRLLIDNEKCAFGYAVINGIMYTE